MNVRSLLFKGVLLLCLVACSHEELDPSANWVSAENVQAMEVELLAMVNSHREAMGYLPLQHSAIAYEYANSHTDYMIAKGDLSHDNFNSRASAIAAETDAEMVAENVAKDYTAAAEALEGWLQSASHRGTMEGDFTHTAVSIKRDPSGTLFFTQLFYR